VRIAFGRRLRQGLSVVAPGVRELAEAKAAGPERLEALQPGVVVGARRGVGEPADALAIASG